MNENTNTQAQDEIIDGVGADNWAQVVAEFAGKTVTEIKAVLDYMAPTEDNEAFSLEIFEEVNRL